MIKNTRNSSLFLIVAGALLLVGALVGIYFLGISPQYKLSKGIYRYALKSQTETQPAAAVTIVPPVIEPVTTGMGSLPVLQPFKTFIHTSNAELENPAIPDRIEIPSIHLIAPVVISDFNTTKVEGETFGQWIAPSKFAAGWHPDSALLGQVGNTVINGHHNEYGEVFGNLVDVQVGDIITVYSGERSWRFVVSNRMILAERFQPAEVRLDNARWLARTDDIRLTLVTCYPKESNTHRLIVVARPLE
jgi:LPXTG-site transpeptidase (sortase) family protein